MQSPAIRRALISVSDKDGLAPLARSLSEASIEIFSTGGTRRFLEEHLIPVKDLSEYTGFPEMMDGRLKTLHPKVFGGILCRHDRPDDMQAIAAYGITPFELIVVNLYPFEETIARPGVTRSEAIEQIDIGGPSLVRAAAKNHQFVTIATSPSQYPEIVEQIRLQGAISLSLRTRLAGEAFARTAEYDRAIATYFASSGEESVLPSATSIVLRKKMELRYGENPHQRAALYEQVGRTGSSLVDARQLNGKELSYNNFLDLDSAVALVRMFAQPAAAVIKHTNPCGAATAERLAIAVRKALDGDPQSAFGSVLAFNRTVDEETADVLCEPGLFIEAIAAPNFEAKAVGMLTTRPKWKENVRLMQVGRLDEPHSDLHYRQILGGMLLQDMDVLPDIASNWQVVAGHAVSSQLQSEMEFAWSIVRHIKSNAIAVCRAINGALPQEPDRTHVRLKMFLDGKP